MIQGMAFLCRYRTLASLPVNKFLDPWSLVVLQSSVSTAACQRSVPHEHFLPATTRPPVPKRRPQPAPKYEARSLSLRPLQSHGVEVRRLGFVSVSTRFPTYSPLHHCGGGLLLSRSSHSPIDVSRTPSRKRRAPPTPGDPPPPHAQSTERAVCYIIGINFAVSCACGFLYRETHAFGGNALTTSVSTNIVGHTNGCLTTQRTQRTTYRRTDTGL
jgi:hypothetical protein